MGRRSRTHQDVERTGAGQRVACYAPYARDPCADESYEQRPVSATQARQQRFEGRLPVRDGPAQAPPPLHSAQNAAVSNGVEDCGLQIR